jgi:Gly-Xaa carboxypeptidase
MLLTSSSAVELLLKSGKFNPMRTVILAFGTDEEVGGKVGALNIGKWLEDKYGADSMAMLIDEGSGIVDVYGQMMAIPAVGEKGYLDVEVRVETPGGHSSVPRT